MIGFLIGTACLVGLVRVLRRGPGARGLRRRRMLNRVFAKLEASPSQEKALAEAMEAVERAGLGLRDELRRGREELARLLREDTIEPGALDAVTARHDVAIAELRARFAESFQSIHDTLDRDQRAVLARLVERGPRGWGHGHHHARHHGPYRDAATL